MRTAHASESPAAAAATSCRVVALIIHVLPQPGGASMLAGSAGSPGRSTIARSAEKLPLNGRIADSRVRQRRGPPHDLPAAAGPPVGVLLWSRAAVTPDRATLPDPDTGSRELFLVKSELR